MEIERQDLINLITDRWFAGSSSVMMVPGVEGVKHDFDKGLVVFGGRAAMTIGPDNIAHEMGHFVELPEKRIIKRNWGFSFGTLHVSGFGVDTIPTTWEATKREIRAWAWQSIILDDIGFELPIPKLVSSAVHMNDYYLVPGDTKEQKLALIAQSVADYKRDLSIERFNDIWFERVGKLPAMFEEARAREARMSAAMEGDIRQSWAMTRKDGNDTIKAIINERSNGEHSGYEVYLNIDGQLCFEGADTFEEHDKALRYAAKMFGGDEVDWSEVPIDPRVSP